MLAPGQATTASSTINLIKTIVGAGLLAIPYAFRADGVLVSILLLLIASSTAGFGLYLLARASQSLPDPRQSSFSTLCAVSYPQLSLLFDFAMFMQCYGVGVSYLILFTDLLPGLFGGTKGQWLLASVVVLGPLTHLGKLDSLKYSSILGLVAIGYLVVLIIAQTTTVTPFPRNDINWVQVFEWNGLASTFPVLVFAYTSSMNLCSIINELQDNSLQNSRKVILMAVGVSTLLFIAVGFAGYMTFGRDVQGNIILNYDPNAWATQIGKFALAIMVLLSFPLMFHPGRLALHNMVCWLEDAYKDRKTAAANTTGAYKNNDDEYHHPSSGSRSGGARAYGHGLATARAPFQPIVSEEPTESAHLLAATTKSAPPALVASASSSTTTTENGVPALGYQSLPRGSSHSSVTSNGNNNNNGNTNNGNIVNPNNKVITDDSKEVISNVLLLTGKRFYVLTWALLISTYLMAYSVDSFAFVLAVVGATGSTAISFTLPGLFAWKLLAPEGESVRPLRYLSGALVIYGLLVTVASLTVLIWSGI